MDERQMQEIRERAFYLNSINDGAVQRCGDDIYDLLDALAAREAEVARLSAIETAARKCQQISESLDFNLDRDNMNRDPLVSTQLAVLWTEAEQALYAALAAPPPGDGAGGGAA
jgi:hypothetical protein